MEEQRYRIEEEGTNGWFQIDNHHNLTKEQATQILNQFSGKVIIPNVSVL